MSDVKRYLKTTKFGNKDELKTPELRRLIRAHNKLMAIQIPKGAKRADILKLITDNGYRVDHASATLVPTKAMKRKPKVTAQKADKLFPRKKP